MHNRQRDFLLLVILAATSMTPALGQGAAPAVFTGNIIDPTWWIAPVDPVESFDEG